MTCFVGVPEEHNKNGRCCCNCNYNVKIMRHPWNVFSGGRMKGPISEIAGYGCNLPDLPGIVFLETEHSLCEEHQFISRGTA